MAKGYIVFTEQVHDEEAMAAYGAKAGASMFAVGGRPLVAGGPEEVLEGDWHGDRTVVLEFESVDAARAWYRSDEYQAVIGERHGAAESNAVLLAGLDL